MTAATFQAGHQYQQSGTSGQFAFAGYAGIAVWGRVDPPADQIRALGRNEKVQVIEDAGGGWLRIRLAEGYEGFVRGDAIRPFAVGTQQMSRQQHDVAGPVAYQASSDGRAFPGSRWVALGLNIFGWIMLVGGQLFAFAAAADYECQSFWGANDCSGEGGQQIAIYLMFAISTLIPALFAFGIAYCIGFLDRIEQRVRSQA